MQVIELKTEAMRSRGMGSPVEDVIPDLQAKVDGFNKAESDAQNKLRSFLKSIDFFDGLNVPEARPTRSDMYGKFSIQPDSSKQRVFGKWKNRLRGTNIYWVQDLPEKQGYKIVLTLRNAFVPPFLDGQDISSVISGLEAQPGVGL